MEIVAPLRKAYINAVQQRYTRNQEILKIDREDSISEPVLAEIREYGCIGGFRDAVEVYESLHDPMSRKKLYMCFAFDVIVFLSIANLDESSARCFSRIVPPKTPW